MSELNAYLQDMQVNVEAGGMAEVKLTLTLTPEQRKGIASFMNAVKYGEVLRVLYDAKPVPTKPEEAKVEDQHAGSW